jgi:hypothetical protein
MQVVRGSSSSLKEAETNSFFLNLIACYKEVYDTIQKNKPLLGFLAVNASASWHVYGIVNALPCCFHGPLH